MSKRKFPLAVFAAFLVFSLLPIAAEADLYNFNDLVIADPPGYQQMNTLDPDYMGWGFNDNVYAITAELANSFDWTGIVNDRGAGLFFLLYDDPPNELRITFPTISSIQFILGPSSPGQEVSINGGSSFKLNAPETILVALPAHELVIAGDGFPFTIENVNTNPVPIPGALFLLFSGICCMGLRGLRHRGT
ncbi:MAG: hypothetical protein WC858_05400 [Parcubacteria group bacterium]|jgi:hypothetical protein